MKYKEKLEEAKKLYASANADQKYVLKSLFPELAELKDDETLRKNLIKAFNTVGGRYWGGLEVREILTWLEKKDEFLPEVKESEDDKIRKEIIAYFKADWAEEEGITRPDWIAWLEKQERKDYNPYRVIIESIAEMCERYSHTKDWKDFYDNVKVKCKDAIEYDNKANHEKRGKQKSIIKMKTPEESLGIDSDTYNEIVDACIYDEQKSADNIEPKFKVGDWVVREYTKDIITTNQVVDFKRIDDEHFGYTLDDETYFSGSWESSYHLWTIEDAKAGDVLVGNYGTFIFMGESNGGYCGVLSDNTFIRSTGNNEMTKGLHPATKEQRDSLLKALADAGWEFDFEKKELKGIEKKSVSITDEWIEDYWQHEKVINPYSHDKGEEIQFDHQSFVRFCKKYCKKPAAWSEEDERMYRGLHNLIYSTSYCDSRKEFSDFLNSLKDRVQPKQGWSEEDEYNFNTIYHLLDLKKEIYKKQENREEFNRYDTLCKWLKSLKQKIGE